jgi:hypothetical protein
VSKKIEMDLNPQEIIECLTQDLSNNAMIDRSQLAGYYFQAIKEALIKELQLMQSLPVSNRYLCQDCLNSAVDILMEVKPGAE